MKKNLSYRDKLIELAQIYNVKEIQEYIRRRKNLTTGQLELILKKNKIIIPKEFNTNFFKENISKPLTKASKQIDDFKEDSSKAVSRLSRKINYLKEDSTRSINRFFINLWRNVGKIGLSFLEILPKLGKTVSSFFGELLTNLFHGVYNQNISAKSARRAVLGSLIIVGASLTILAGITTVKNLEGFKNNEVVKKLPDNEKPKKETKKPEIKQKKQDKKEEKKLVKKPKEKVKKDVKKKEKVTELILPDLNLKTETVLSLFEDVDYDLNTVRYEKTVKPIYFTQFPKDLDEIQSVQLKKETFIKIVLPLIVAENEKILDDRYKLNKIASKKMTSDEENNG